MKRILALLLLTPAFSSAAAIEMNLQCENRYNFFTDRFTAATIQVGKVENKITLIPQHIGQHIEPVLNLLDPNLSQKNVETITVEFTPESCNANDYKITNGQWLVKTTPTVLCMNDRRKANITVAKKDGTSSTFLKFTKIELGYEGRMDFNGLGLDQVLEITLMNNDDLSVVDLKAQFFKNTFYVCR